MTSQFSKFIPALARSLCHPLTHTRIHTPSTKCIVCAGTNPSN